MELPLFEKLFMLDSNQASSEFLSEKQYLASIRAEISRLLETRVSTDVRMTANHNITTYGIPDAFFSELQNDLKVSWAENYLVSMITYFEPRVSNVKVKILQKPRKSPNAEISFNYEYNGELFGIEFEADM